MNDLQNFQFYDKYSSVKSGRRQTYTEAVTDTVDFLYRHFGLKNFDLYNVFITAMNDMTVFPSLRLFNQNPNAVNRDNSVIYNCSAFHIDSFHDIASVLYLSMSGAGCGLGIEQSSISKLQAIRPTISGLTEFITIEDSQAGWADSFCKQMELEAKGVTVFFDYTKIRPAGTRLETKNGIASGPEPLIALHNFTRTIFNAARGRQLTVTEVADLVNYIGGVAISGGNRRSSEILLGDNSAEFANLKYDKFYNDKPWRANSNNSIIINDYTDYDYFDSLLHVFNNSVGEPGLFSRYSAKQSSPQRRYLTNDVLTNPCGEILLRDSQFCNLTQVNMRPRMTEKQLYKAVEVATIIGTIQTMFDEFNFINSDFRNNAIDERLLGVSLSNMYSALHLVTPAIMAQAKAVAIVTNKKWANYFGINQSSAITCVKPSGNSSVLANLPSPGVHPAFSKYYKRNVVLEPNTPMTEFLIENNWPMIPHPYKNAYLAQFVSTAGDCPTTNEVTAIEHLELWKVVQCNWVEHSTSATIYYSQNEVPQIKDWLWYNQGIVNGISFLQRDENDYPYSPIEPITEKEYESFNPPKINWEVYATYQVDKHTQKQVAECTGDVCHLSI